MLRQRALCEGIGVSNELRDDPHVQNVSCSHGQVRVLDVLVVKHTAISLSVSSNPERYRLPIHLDAGDNRLNVCFTTPVTSFP